MGGALPASFPKGDRVAGWQSPDLVNRKDTFIPFIDGDSRLSLRGERCQKPRGDQDNPQGYPPPFRFLYWGDSHPERRPWLSKL